MKKLILAMPLACLILLTNSGDGFGSDATYGVPSCNDYLDAYSRTKLSGSSTFRGPPEVWGAFGWIDGYLTQYNMMNSFGIRDITKNVTFNDTYRWIASWCRDNPAFSLDRPIGAFIVHQIKKYGMGNLR